MTNKEEKLIRLKQIIGHIELLMSRYPIGEMPREYVQLLIDRVWGVLTE